MIKLEYDPNYTLSYNLWRCPECGNTFYGGGRAIHKDSCSQTGYEKCICVIGPKIVARVKEWAKTEGKERQVPLSPVSLHDIEEQLPEVL